MSQVARFKVRQLLYQGVPTQQARLFRDVQLMLEQVERNLEELSNRRYVAQFNWTAASTDTSFFTAERDYVIKSITARVDTAGTDAGAVTAIIRNVGSGTALASGTAVHTGSINLKGTAATNQTLTLDTTDAAIKLESGESLAIDFTGVLTAAAGSVSVHIMPT